MKKPSHFPLKAGNVADLIHDRMRVHTLEKAPREIPVFFIQDFDDLGKAEAVRMALFRLTQDGKIIRLGQGVYQYPVPAPAGLPVSTLRASAETIAEAIARRDGVQIIPSEDYALNRLGLSTQVPMNLVYATDGVPRDIKIGKRRIVFQRASPRRFKMKGKISRLVAQALIALGKDGVNADVLEKIHRALDHESEENIRHDADYAYAWIKKTLIDYLRNKQ